MMSKINILLIDDNPNQYSIPVTYAKNLGLFPTELNCDPNDAKLPIINFKGLNSGYEKYFKLMHLKSPIEIKEFMSLNLEIEDRFSSEELGSVGFVPNVVAFDYYLREYMDLPLLGITEYNRSVFEYFNPNYRLLEFLKSKLLRKKEDKLTRDFNPDYDDAKLFSKGFSDYENDKKDNMGLFAGVEISRLFRNNLCIGIPVTFMPSDKDHLIPEALFYEFINEYDFGTMFNREHRSSKNWDNIITDAVKQLRIRLEVLITSNKVKVSLSELMNYASGDSEFNEEKGITIFSSYGIQVLPVNGLFIDFPPFKFEEQPSDLLDEINSNKSVLDYCYSERDRFQSMKSDKVNSKNNPKNQKKEEKINELTSTINSLQKKIHNLSNYNNREYHIWDFTKRLIKSLCTQSGISSSVIIEAFKGAEELWDVANGSILLERFQLSLLFSRKYLLGEKLSNDEEDTLTNFCSTDHFNILDCHTIVDQVKGKKLTEQVNKKIYSIKEYGKGEESKTKIVLMTLFLTIRLEYKFILFMRNNSDVLKTNSISFSFKEKPTWKELLFVLFPSPRIPLLSLAHLDYGGSNFKKRIMDDQFQSFFRDLGWNSLPKNLDFSKSISYGEKIICQWFATSIGMETKDYPNWLK